MSLIIKVKGMLLLTSLFYLPLITTIIIKNCIPTMLMTSTAAALLAIMMVI